MKTTLTVGLFLIFGLIYEATGAPLVTITSPTNGAVLSAPASFTIRTSVENGGNAVSQIEFFTNGVSVAVDTTNPYRVDITDLAGGNYTLTAVLTDTLGDKSTNSVSIFVNELPAISITTPVDGSGLIAPATFLLAATASDMDGSVSRIQFFRDGTSIGVATTNPASVLVKNLSPGNYRLTAQATDNLGGQTVSRVDIIVKTRPTVVFTSPSANARLTAVTNLFEGTADDTRGLSGVEYSLNGSLFQATAGAAHWSTSAVLPPGTNVMRIRAVDDYGNYSLTNTRSFFQVVTSALTLTVSGNGTVSGATDGQILEVNRGYRLVATPAAGQVFSNWTGQVSGSRPTLDFLMQSNLMVQANFVPNPFTKIIGTFTGLFYETNQAQHSTSGDFRLKVAPTGKYSAVVRLAGRKYSTTGQLDLEGQATNHIPRLGTNALTVAWLVDLNGLDEVRGNVTDGQWVSTLQGDRLIFNSLTNPATLAGRYTMSLPGSDQAGLPEGHGWATLRMTTAGLVTLVGSLPDGTRVVAKAPLSKNRVWPFYAPVNQLQGSVIGWVQFDETAPSDDLQGDIDWFKPAQPGGVFYPSGFSYQTTVTGSRYTPPVVATDRVLALTNGVLVLSGGNLSQAWTNSIGLGPGNRMTNAGPNELKVSLTLGTGLFKGQFIDPISERIAAFTGVVLQKSIGGAGCFLGTNASGRVWIEPRP
jgi:hypothetical protein